MIEIINFEDKYADDFSQLNLEWLYRYNLAESHDLEVLNDPRGTIINRGGYVFLAVEDGNVVGTAALAKEHDGVYELAKMSVAPLFRGRGISKMLMVHCLGKARELSAKKIILFSNHQLVTALHLYKRFGFTDVPVTDSPFETADVKMELVFQ